MNISRRHFLRSSLAASTGSFILTSLPAQSFENVLSSSELDVRAIKSAWHKSMTISPGTHLKNMNIEVGGISVHAQIKSDFENNKTISVDGLLLSQTETAILLFSQGVV